MTRSLGIDTGFVRDGKRVFVGTTCANPGRRRLARDTGLVLGGKRVFVSADCVIGVPGRSLAKKLRRKDGKWVYAGACCSGECCANAPLPDTIDGTVSAYGYDWTDPFNPIPILISENPITVTKVQCTSGDFAGMYAWVGDGTLEGCDDNPNAPCGIGGSGFPGCPVHCQFFCTTPTGVPSATGNQWYCQTNYGDIDPGPFTGSYTGCPAAGTLPLPAFPTPPVSVTCDPLCVTFTGGSTPDIVNDPITTCRGLVFRFGDGCPASSGGGGIQTAACPNPISTVLSGAFHVTSGTAPGLDGASVTLVYIGNSGGTDIWRGTLTVGGHLIYVDLTIDSGGTVFLLPFGAETNCLDASGGLESVDCGPPFTVSNSFSTLPGDACFPSITFTLSLSE